MNALVAQPQGRAGSSGIGVSVPLACVTAAVPPACPPRCAGSACGHATANVTVKQIAPTNIARLIEPSLQLTKFPSLNFVRGQLFESAHQRRMVPPGAALCA